MPEIDSPTPETLEKAERDFAPVRADRAHRDAFRQRYDDLRETYGNADRTLQTIAMLDFPRCLGAWAYGDDRKPLACERTSRDGHAEHEATIQTEPGEFIRYAWRDGDALLTEIDAFTTTTGPVQLEIRAKASSAAPAAAPAPADPPEPTKDRLIRATIANKALASELERYKAADRQGAELARQMETLISYVRQDLEKGSREVAGALKLYGYDSLRFADVRHGWASSTQFAVEFMRAYDPAFMARLEADAALYVASDDPDDSDDPEQTKPITGSKEMTGPNTGTTGGADPVEDDPNAPGEGGTEGDTGGYIPEDSTGLPTDDEIEEDGKESEKTPEEIAADKAARDVRKAERRAARLKKLAEKAKKEKRDREKKEKQEREKTHGGGRGKGSR